MSSCAKCNRELPQGARVCKYCGADVRPESVFFPGVPAPSVNRVRVNLASEPAHSYGVSMIKAMRVLAVVLSAASAVGMAVYGGVTIHGGSVLPGILMIVGGIVLGFALYFLFCMGIIFYENVSMVGFNTEKSQLIADNSIHLLQQMIVEQKNQLDDLRRQTEMLEQLVDEQEERAEVSDERNTLLRQLISRLDDSNKQSDAQTTLLKQLACEGENRQRADEQRAADQAERQRRSDELQNRQFELLRLALSAKSARQDEPERPSAEQVRDTAPEQPEETGGED